LEAGVDHVEGGGRREPVCVNVNRKRFIDSHRSPHDRLWSTDRG
jgi:hypothetical protein